MLKRLHLLDFSPKSRIMWEKVVESGRTPVTRRSPIKKDCSTNVLGSLSAQPR